MPAVATVPVLSPAEDAVVRTLAADAELVDGTPPLSEDARLALAHPGVTHLLAWANGTIVGYAQLAPAVAESAAWTLELVVAAPRRRRGHGGRLVACALAAAGKSVVQAWAHGSLPGARVLAERHAFAPVRELRRLSRGPGDLPEVPLPPGIHLRTFTPEDAPALLELNGRAFAGHPEQGTWTAHDLGVRMAQDDFDPAGLFLAETPDGRLAGFHWTKLHRLAERPAGHGEVYVLGVDPAAQGGGLGRALLVAGLRHLYARVPDVVLYVDADNASAVRLYEGLGFKTASVDVLYRRARPPSSEV